MKFLCAISSVALLGIVMCACMADTPREAADTQAPGVASSEGPQDVPQELTLPALLPAACPGGGQRFIRGFEPGCVVTLNCHDERHGCRPTFCSNGGCPGTAPGHAVVLCGQCNSCNPANLIQLAPGC